MGYKDYKYLYRTSRWKSSAKKFIYNNPVCRYCGHMATVVNHKTPHKGDESIFWDKGNWESVCKQCHDSTVAKLENGKVDGKDMVINNVSDENGMPTSKSHPWNKGAI